MCVANGKGRKTQEKIERSGRMNNDSKALVNDRAGIVRERERDAECK